MAPVGGGRILGVGPRGERRSLGCGCGGDLGTWASPLFVSQLPWAGRFSVHSPCTTRHLPTGPRHQDMRIMARHLWDCEPKSILSLHRIVYPRYLPQSQTNIAPPSTSKARQHQKVQEEHRSWLAADACKLNSCMTWGNYFPFIYDTRTRMPPTSKDCCRTNR